MNRSSTMVALSGALLLCTIALTYSRPVVAKDPSIDQLVWQRRLLIVFANPHDASSLDKQRVIATQARKDFAERDLDLIQVVGNDVTGTSDSADSLRQRFNVSAGTFRALLIGKDGGVKIDSRQPVTQAQLVSTIDAMPMRRQETNGSNEKQ